MFKEKQMEITKNYNNIIKTNHRRCGYKIIELKLYKTKANLFFQNMPYRYRANY